MSTWLRGALPADAVARLDDWLASCARAPGELPPGVDLVQTRLIRTVGRGDLPGIGAAFVKVMGFPRGKDRLRYVHRALPACHEARVLDAVAARAPDLPSPQTLAWSGVRASGLVPKLSVLVTRGLDVDAAAPVPSLADRADAARRLCDVGIEHGDLHAGNFVRLQDGRTAVLDLQSAHLRDGPVGTRARVRVAAKLIESEAAEVLDVVVARGLVAETEREDVRARAARLRARTIERRVRRCMQESSEFARSIGVAAVRHLRRGAAAESALVRCPDPDAPKLWIGDRVREVLDGAPPLLAGVVLPLLPLLGARPALLLGSDDAAARVEADRTELLAAFARYRALSRPA